ncbi:unnamed protein product [Spodoptera exigua]|nr:unnamed protein product [Spodoptera exigua]
MESDTKKGILDALLRRRQVLSAIYERRRLKPLKTLNQQEEPAVNMPHNISQHSQQSILSDSDVIEDSDSERPAKRTKKPQTIIMDSTTSNSEVSFSTSKNTSSLSHPYHDNDAISINSPVKADTNKKINIISNIIVKKPNTKSNKENVLPSSSITIVNNSPDKNVTLSTSNVDEINTPVDVDTDFNAVIPSMYVVSDTESNTLAPVNVSDLNVATPLPYYVDTTADPDLSTLAYIDTHLDTSLYNVDAASSGLSPTVDINTDISSMNKTEAVLPALDEQNILNVASTSGYNAAADLVSPSADNNIQTNFYTDTSSIKNTNPASPCMSVKKAKKRPVRGMHKNILDFLSDDDTGDYSAGSSDDWVQENTSESSDDDTSKTKKKKLKKFKKQETDIIKRKKIIRVNKRKLGKIKKDKGKEYETEKGRVVQEKKMQSNPCKPDKCKRGCYDITEERRATLFNFYWSLDSQRRKDWLVRSTHIVPCARKRTDSSLSRRNLTYEYYVNNGDDHQKVCQKFLISTLDITQKFLLYTLNNSANEMAQKDRRQRNTSNKYSDFAKTQVKQFIEKLPAVPSHYNRKRTNRVYLPQELKNVSNLYRLYLKECQSSNIEFVSESIFRGHTYMPVDSVHATIEREVKKITVWSPTQWPSYIEAARKNPRPYNVNVMEYSDFLNWNEITAETFTTETCKTLKIRNIRIITLKKKNPNVMYIKYSMKEETSTDKVILFKKSGNKEKGKGRGKGRSKSRTILPEEGVSNNTHEEVMIMSPTALYKNKLQISDVKYRDLKRLCDNGIIPKRYHHDYINLPHGNVADSLTLTDEEDEEELI